MTFSKEQIEALKAPLNKNNVKQRSQAGRQLSYIEGWHAIDEANRIFGFSAWDRELLTLKELGEPRQVDGKWRVAYMATVRITVRPEQQMDINWSVTRDGTGYGSGIDKDLGAAHESAIKEAETDAMKRALMTFGNPFGLALYDKEQKNVATEAASSVVIDKTSDRTLANALKATLAEAMTTQELAKWFRDNQAAIEGLPEALTGEVRAAYAGRLHELKTARAA